MNKSSSSSEEEFDFGAATMLGDLAHEGGDMGAIRDTKDNQIYLDRYVQWR